MLKGMTKHLIVYQLQSMVCNLDSHEMQKEKEKQKKLNAMHFWRLFYSESPGIMSQTLLSIKVHLHEKKNYGVI